MCEPTVQPPRALIVGPATDDGVDLPGLVEPDLDRARDRLRAGEHDVAFVHRDAGGRGSGVEWIREQVARGCTLPLVLVLPREDAESEAAALQAGATACVDLSRADGRELERVARFLHAAQRRLAARQARLLDELGAFVAHEGKNAVAGISGAVQVVSDHLAPGATDRALCGEIRLRLAAFAGTLDRLGRLLHGTTTGTGQEELAAFLRGVGDRARGDEGD